MKNNISKYVYMFIAIVSWSIALATIIIVVSDHITAKKLSVVEADDTSEPISFSTNVEPTSAEKERETVEVMEENHTELPDEPEAEVSLTEPEITVPDELNEILFQNGITVQQLNETGCSQLVTVVSSESSAKIDYYCLVDYTWIKDEEMSCSGYVGSNGVSSEKHEGDYSTPAGLYSIGEAFYIYSVPETGLNTFEVTEDTYWVDDPNSVFYNQRVEGTSGKDWTSAEHMIDYQKAYEYGYVINYNTEGEYNAGSAVFFHVSSGSTAGCVGTDRDMVLKYLAKLDSEYNPYILIT